MAVIPNSPGPASVVPGAGGMLALLLGINLFNYIDRQVLSAVLPRLARDASILALDDPNAQLKLGLLTSAFMATYMTLSLFFGWLDSRGVRRWVILGVGVSLWSLASGSSGLATGYAMLLATRCLVGIGEAAYGPIASAMIADLYPVDRRGKAMALFNMAIPVGSALGFVIGGTLADYYNDWRYAFYATFAGLVLGVVCFSMREPPRPAVTPADRVPYLVALRELWGNRSYVLCCTGMTAIVFVIGGVAAWIPAYVFERESKFVFTAQTLDDLRAGDAKDHREPVPADIVARLQPLVDEPMQRQPELKKQLASMLTPPEAAAHANAIFDVATTKDSPTLGGLTTTFGGILVVGGFLATALGAWIGERLRTRIRGGYFWVIGIGALIAFPCYLGILYAPFPLAWVFTFLTIIGLFLHTGPAFTLLANVTRSRIRATAFAINILVIHLLGDSISPIIIGAVADASNLQTAFLLMSVMILLGGTLWILGAKTLDADTAKAA